eukprot:COSAG05_NODE_529_length_8913_cov_14.963921_2_plen_85_part_00
MRARRIKLWVDPAPRRLQTVTQRYSCGRPAPAEQVESTGVVDIVDSTAVVTAVEYSYASSTSYTPVWPYGGATRINGNFSILLY